MIRFLCACGKRVKVPASAAGKRVRCPFCGKEQRVPETGRPDVPVAEVVAEALETSAPADGLAALAQAVKTNGGAAAPRRDLLGGTKNGRRAPPPAVRNGLKRQNLPTSAQLIARRTGAIPNHRKYFLIGIGAALGLILIVVMIARVAGSRGSAEPRSGDPAEPQPVGHVARRGGTPGELFKNVPFEEKPSESADAAPAASP